MTREEHEKLTKEKMKFFAELDKQIAEERRERDEFLSTLSEEERIKFFWEEDKKIHAEAVGRFSSSVKMVTKKDE